ncbi:MAG TPA: neutral zinc metallopeptidase [Acidimicrobiia bacterium]|nr:neutral zinc metallopeptidase [Acidimicrobiia bacterium]
MRSGVGWAAGIVATTALAALVPAAGVASASVTRAKEPAYEETVRLTVDDLQDYWASELPALYGVDYRKIPASRIIAYTSTSRIPRCGPGRVSYKDVAENAFYCNAGKFVAYDDENLFPQLAEQFGDLTIALTLAHEWGHAVQDQAELTGPTIALEQQADCFAGAWVRNVGEGASKLLTLNQGNLDTGLAGFLSFRARRGLIRQQTAPTGVRSTGSARSRRATTMGRNAAPISRTTRRR